MAKFWSICPHCGDDIVRTYGDMGEGLISETRCGCYRGLTVGEWAAIILSVLGLLVAACR